ncbi:hypothetical protein C8J57DRAFT_1211418 [Mycena rebaudengoi]|nr:hypothetical protein C8J57DRAFT_1211418 [Mycena rebaudengoi]
MSSNQFLNNLLQHRHSATRLILGWEEPDMDFVATQDQTDDKIGEVFSCKTSKVELQIPWDGSRRYYRGRLPMYSPLVIGEVIGVRQKISGIYDHYQFTLGCPMHAGEAMQVFYMQQTVMLQRIVELELPEHLQNAYKQQRLCGGQASPGCPYNGASKLVQNTSRGWGLSSQGLLFMSGPFRLYTRRSPRKLEDVIALPVGNALEVCQQCLTRRRLVQSEYEHNFQEWLDETARRGLLHNTAAAELIATWDRTLPNGKDLFSFKDDRYPSMSPVAFYDSRCPRCLYEPIIVGKVQEVFTKDSERSWILADKLNEGWLIKVTHDPSLRPCSPIETRLGWTCPAPRDSVRLPVVIYHEGSFKFWRPVSLLPLLSDSG